MFFSILDLSFLRSLGVIAKCNACSEMYLCRWKEAREMVNGEYTEELKREICSLVAGFPCQYPLD